MSAETAEALGVSAHHRVYPIQEWEGHYTIGTWWLSPFDAVHDTPCLGFYLISGDERLLYLTDSAYCRYKFPGLTQIMVSANYDLDLLNANIESGKIDRAAKARLMHSHASLSTIKELLRANDLSKLKEVHLLHLSSRNADAERFKKEIGEIVGVPVYVH